MDRLDKILSIEEVQVLTGYERKHAQKRALDRMGVDYWTRPDGRPVVSVDALNRQGGTPREPNFGALQSNRNHK